MPGPPVEEIADLRHLTAVIKGKASLNIYFTLYPKHQHFVRRQNSKYGFLGRNF